MQYRYREKSSITNWSDAIQAKLRDPASIAAFRAHRLQEKRNYAGRHMDFEGNVRFQATNGEHIRIAGMPLYSRDPGVMRCLPDTSANHAAAHVAEKADSTTVSPPGDPPPREREFDLTEAQKHKLEQETGLKPVAARATTPALSGLLSVTAAIAVGIIIANNNSFRLKVPDGNHGDIVTANAQVSSAASVAAVAARPARPLAAPPAPALSIPRHEHPQVAIRQAHKVRAPAKQKSMRPGSESSSVRRAPKAKATRLAKQAPRAPLVQATTKVTARAESREKISSVLPRQTRQSLPGLGRQYARCAQLNGLLRRERCKWDVCGNKWGKQGCPSYQSGNGVGPTLPG